MNFRAPITPVFGSLLLAACGGAVDLGSNRSGLTGDGGIETGTIDNPYGGDDGYGYGDPYGTGYGYGDPYGTGYGYGDPYGTGYGYGDPYGTGYGYADPYGTGYGYGDPYGTGYGYGDPYGTGYGYGTSYGYGSSYAPAPLSGAALVAHQLKAIPQTGSLSVGFVWKNTAGRAPANDLTVTRRGDKEPAIQIFQVGNQAFARAGLEVARLEANTQYAIVLERSGDTVVARVERAGQVVLTTSLAASASESLADFATPATIFRQNVRLY